MELFAKIIIGFQSFIIFAKSTPLDADWVLNVALHCFVWNIDFVKMRIFMCDYLDTSNVLASISKIFLWKHYMKPALKITADQPSVTTHFRDLSSKNQKDLNNFIYMTNNYYHQRVLKNVSWLWLSLLRVWLWHLLVNLYLS